MEQGTPYGKDKKAAPGERSGFVGGERFYIRSMQTMRLT